MIFPWRVDVPQDRWPVMNWLVILMTIGVFVLQMSQLADFEPPKPGSGEELVLPGITGSLMLDGWDLKGLVGHMWLHADLFHLLGNMWFLWLFGNAVCAKIGNVRYALLYVLFGVAGGVAHLLLSGGRVLGASGAMNGVAGMYLVLFYENSITCYFLLWLGIPFYIRAFTVSSCWMILFWLFWDLVGAFSGGSGVAHFAHLGGFGAGFGLAILMCKHGWVTMERYEKSLLQMWEERKARKAKAGPARRNDRLGVSVAAAETAAAWDSESTQVAERSSPAPEPIPLLSLADGLPRQKEAPDEAIRLACACGKRLKVPGRYAGRSGRCPQCGCRLRIPQAS